MVHFSYTIIKMFRSEPTADVVFSLICLSSLGGILETFLIGSKFLYVYPKLELHTYLVLLSILNINIVYLPQ